MVERKPDIQKDMNPFKRSSSYITYFLFFLVALISSFGRPVLFPHFGGDESRLPGEISITSDMQMTPPLWQKVKRN